MKRFRDKLVKVRHTMKHEAKWVEQTYPTLPAISEEASTVSSVSDYDYHGDRSINRNKKFKSNNIRDTTGNLSLSITIQKAYFRPQL